MLESNDPKLTAFAFGELPAEEQAEVAALVAASPELASQVTAIRGLGEQLSALLSNEPCPALSEAERTAILQAAGQDRLAEVSIVNPPAVQSASHRQRRFWIYSTAAALLLAVSLFFAIPLAVRYTQTPLYRSSAWLRVEEEYINFGPPADNTELVPEDSAETSDSTPVEEEWILAEPIAQLQIRISAKEAEQELLKAKAIDLKEELARQLNDIDIKPLEKQARGKPEVQKLDQEISALRESIPPLGSKEFASDFPKHIAQRKDLIVLENKRDALISAFSNQAIPEPVALEKKRQQEQLDKALVRVAQNQLEIDILREKLEAQRAEIAKTGGSALERSFKNSELRREERVVEMISGRIMRLRREFAAPAKVWLVRKAEPSSIPDSNESIWSFWFKKWQSAPPPSTVEENPRRTFMQTQIQLIHSPLVLEQVLARPDVAQYEPLAKAATPITWLSERISVNAGNNSELFIIDFICDDPSFAALIANATAEAYLHKKAQDEADTQGSTRVVELLEDERARRMVVIQQLREQLDEMKAKAAGKVRAPSEKE
jgi:hypothetical protein